LKMKKMGADYAVDVYPHYGSDVEATLRAGYCFCYYNNSSFL